MTNFLLKNMKNVASDIFNNLCKNNDASSDEEEEKMINSTSKFYSLKIPKISLEKYFERICEYMIDDDIFFVIAIIYLDRLISLNTSMKLNSHNVHRF